METIFETVRNAIQEYESAKTAYFSDDFMSRSEYEMTSLKEKYDDAAHKIARLASIMLERAENGAQI